MAFDINYSLGSRGTASYEVIDTQLDTSLAVIPSLDTGATITDSLGTTTLFNGRIIGVSPRAAVDAKTGTISKVTAVDYTLAMDSRIVLAETYNTNLKAIVTDLRDTYLVTYGITLDAGMATGPTLSVSFDHLTMTEVLNRLSDLTGWVWRITPALVLEFFAVGTKTTTFSLTSTNANVIGGVTWSRSRKQYLNRLHVEYGPTAVLHQTQTFAAATAGQTTWTLDQTAVGINLRGYITVSGVFTPIGDGMTWYFDIASNAVKRSPAAAGGEVVVVDYDAQFPAAVTSEDAAEIALLGGQIYEDTIKAPDITDKDEAQELADALLLKYKAAPRMLTVRTRAGLTLPGNVVTITIPERTVSGSWLITDVRITAGIDKQIDYDLTCVEGSAKQNSWQDSMRQLSSGGSRASGTFSGHMLPQPSGQFEGVVTSSHSPLLISAHMGFVGTSAGAGTIGPGIDMNAGASGAGRWIWVAGPAGPGTKALALLYVNGTGSADMPAAWWWDSLNGQYKLSPITATSVTTPIVLGDKVQSFSTGRFDEINGKVLDASLGYLERGRTAKVGDWTIPAYNAANFTASSGTWTVDLFDAATYQYAMVGKTMTVLFTIVQTDVSATPTHLRIAIPGGFSAAKTVYNTVIVSDAGTVGTGLASVAASGTLITVQKIAPSGNWSTTSGDNTDIYGQITFEVI